jgi:hypothetical protein
MPVPAYEVLKKNTLLNMIYIVPLQKIHTQAPKRLYTVVHKQCQAMLPGSVSQSFGWERP